MPSHKHDSLNPKVKLSLKEKRFIKFASAEYNGQLYMTPQDFLESLIDPDPRRFLHRKTLTSEDIQNFKEATPSRSEGSPRLFRTLQDNGIISYSEYLFLLTILSKPQSGFEIAFNMFDVDGNQRVDKDEFQVLETIFSATWKDKRGITSEEKKQYVDDELGLQRAHTVDTTLLVHFFGPKGNLTLNFESFKRFMLDLQREVLELEFNQFSKGLPTISEVDFAKIVLKYTYLHSERYRVYLDRLVDRIEESHGITFDDFTIFCQFLNNFEDFNIAVMMYTLTKTPLSQENFNRAVRVCVGSYFSPHLLNTIFAMFDDNGDGLLSYSEFIGIMRERLHRGYKFDVKHTKWRAFKKCVIQDLKDPSKMNLIF